MSTTVGRGTPSQNYQTTEVPIATAKALTDYVACAVQSGTLTLPSDQAWNTDEATTRSDFVATFVGINAQLKQANVARIPGNSQDNVVVIENQGEYDVVVESATYAIGDYLGPSKAAGNALIDTSFKKVTPVAGACFIVVKNYGTATTLVRARVVSTKVPAAKFA